MSVPSTTTTTASIPIIGSIFDGLLDQVNQSINSAIQSAQNAADNVLVEAGRQVNIAIQNAKIAYADSLQLTIDKVSEAARKQINDIQSMVLVLQDKTSKELHTLEGRAQQWINTLPFANTRQPQLTTVFPRGLIIDDKAQQALLKFSGNFVFASDTRYTPTFSLGDKKFTLANSTTQELGYMVSMDKASLHNATYVVGTLQVPWNNNTWIWPWADNRVAEYKVWLKALPLCPGKITVTYTSKTTKTVTERYSSPNIHEDGNSSYPIPWVVRIHVINAQPGYRFNPETAVAKVTSSHGTDKVEITARDQNAITLSVGLDCADGHHMGILDCHVEVDQSHEVTTVNSRTQSIDLKWGDSVILDPQAGEEVSKIVFDAFDGSHSEFAGPDLSNPYLKVLSESGKLQLKATVPSEANLKAMALAQASKKESDSKASASTTTAAVVSTAAADSKQKEASAPTTATAVASTALAASK